MTSDDHSDRLAPPVRCRGAGICCVTAAGDHQYVAPCGCDPLPAATRRCEGAYSGEMRERLIRAPREAAERSEVSASLAVK